MAPSLFEKLIVAQIVIEFLALHETRGFVFTFIRSRCWSLSQARIIQSTIMTEAYLLGFDAVEYRSSPMFRKNIMSPSSESKSKPSNQQTEPLNLVHAFSSHFFKIRLNGILPSMSRSTMSSLSFRFTRNLKVIATPQAS